MELVWREDYSVGVPKLDGQHKRIFKLMNALVELGEVSASSTEVSDALTKMTEYSIIHFADEEKYMASINFPRSREHEQEHREFAEKITEFSLDIMDGDGETQKKIIDFLCFWWRDHVLKKDMDYRRFVEGDLS